MSTTPPPRYRTPNGRDIRWHLIVKAARRQPEHWILALPDTSVGAIRTIATRRAWALRSDDGRLEGELRNPYDTPDGTRRGDIYVKWSPATPKEN